MQQNDLRKALNEIIRITKIKSKTIVAETGINAAILSRFKNGQVDLCLRDTTMLKQYLTRFNSNFII